MFKDLFSGHAKDYAQFRPNYPDELFVYLASQCRERNLVWDVGTGNGQAAFALAKYFERVYATDASQQQIDIATPAPNIKYDVLPAETSHIESRSCDLITVAQALHWFKLEEFSREMRRVIKPGGVFAAWSYAICSVSPEVDRVVDYFYTVDTKLYWDPARKLVEDGYRSVSLPIKERATPKLELKVKWDLREFVGYLNTWSAVQKALRDTGTNPLEKIERDLTTAWGAPRTVRDVVWPLNLRVGDVIL